MSPNSKRGSVSILDTGGLPVEDLATLAQREGRRPLALYHAHRWFARRFSSAFRAILVAAEVQDDADFWAAYYEGVDYHDRCVLDPFVGGGTSVVEAARLGASAIGVDIDPVACAITRFELRAADAPNVDESLATLQKHVGRRLARYYTTFAPSGEERQILHAFWVQIVDCSNCGEQVEAHPHYQLAFEAEGKRQWAFCRHCHAVQELNKSAVNLHCRECCTRTVIAQGTVDHGTLCCPHCDYSEKLIDVGLRTGEPPSWYLFALETIPVGEAYRLPMTERQFQRAENQDRDRMRAARRALLRRKENDGIRWIPRRQIPSEERSDNRVLHYSYKAYHELFNDRQLLHLSILAEEIDKVDGKAREALALAFSDHLTTNCMMTHYAFGWRRLAPLFSIRAFRHVPRPVEINPWLDGTGRGTFPNAVRQVQRAINSARSPEVAHLDGGFLHSGSLVDNGQKRVILEGSSSELVGVEDKSVDLILTDPPYFDNIAYSELSDFYLPWLQALGLTPQSHEKNERPMPNLAARSRNDSGYEVFRQGLADCFRQMRRVLKDGGRLVFTYQHRTPEAWNALAFALSSAGWRSVCVFPLLGNSNAGLHRKEGTITWDAVSVWRKGRKRSHDRLKIQPQISNRVDQNICCWSDRLDKLKDTPFLDVDRQNLHRAMLVGASLGLFDSERHREGRALSELLSEVS